MAREECNGKHTRCTKCLTSIGLHRSNVAPQPRLKSPVGLCTSVLRFEPAHCIISFMGLAGPHCQPFVIQLALKDHSIRKVEKEFLSNT
jgi:hypothetical protein